MEDIIKCDKCGSPHLEVQLKGNHKALYCRDCGSFVRWVRRNEINTIDDILREANAEKGPCWACGQDYVIPTGYGEGGISSWYNVHSNYCPECGRKLT